MIPLSDCPFVAQIAFLFFWKSTLFLERKQGETGGMRISRSQCATMPVCDSVKVGGLHRQSSAGGQGPRRLGNDCGERLVTASGKTANV